MDVAHDFLLETSGATDGVSCENLIISIQVLPISRPLSIVISIKMSDSVLSHNSRLVDKFTIWDWEL